MSDEKQNTAVQLLRWITTALVSQPESVECVLRENDGSTIFMLRVHPDDEPLAIGVAGSIVRSLASILSRCGRAVGQHWTLRLVTETEPRQRERKPRKIALSYDPSEAKNLLTFLVGQIGLSGKAQVAVTTPNFQSEALLFIFRIQLKDERDAQAMIAQPEPGEIPVLVAINTIFKAIGKREGVRFDVIREVRP